MFRDLWCVFELSSCVCAKNCLAAFAQVNCDYHKEAKLRTENCGKYKGIGGAE